jgi:hypothetical protein
MIWNREPVLFLSAVQTIVALAVSFGVGLSAEQVGAITAVTAAVLGVWSRSRVTPVE